MAQLGKIWADGIWNTAIWGNIWAQPTGPVGSSNTLVYTISRAIGSVETVTLDYVQPGNGVEDGEGNDLSSFSGRAVTNNSIV